MKSSMKIIFLLALMLSSLKCNDENQTATDSIDFVLNECTLSIPNFYDIAVSSKANIVFMRSMLYLNLENSVSLSLNLVDGNATKILLDDFNKSSGTKIDKIKKEKNLTLITFLNEETLYIVGNKFYIYASKDNVHTQRLIERCNETWHDDLYIEGLETLADKILKDFYYTPSIGVDKERALKIQKKLERIYVNSLDE